MLLEASSPFVRQLGELNAQGAFEAAGRRQSILICVFVVGNVTNVYAVGTACPYSTLAVISNYCQIS
jgi:hypothetical protein